MEKALADIPSAEALADIIELRLDLIESPDLPVLLKNLSKSCIVTNRTKLEGGQFRGTEENRVRVLRQAMDLGVDYIDIETSTPKEYLQPILEAKGKTKTILSYHNFTNTMEDLNPLYEIMCELAGDVIKIATYAQHLSDNIKIFKLLQRARKEGKPLIALGMGEKGEISRILSPLFGGLLTFGSLESGKETAPGQIPARVLRDVYRIQIPRPSFKIYGVIGNPVAKSMGYLIHNRAFKEIDSPDIYVPFLVDNAEKFFSEFSDLFAGLSVTMPFKEDLAPLLNRVDPMAQKIGAINTVVREGQAWVGYNTDCSGALQALQEQIELKGKKVLIIGAGGTAKAIGFGVVAEGAQLTVTYNRNRQKGEDLAQALNCDLVSIRELGERSFDVVINCSPVGMHPDTGETPLSSRHLKAGMVVFDSVYNPPETRLIREARQAGCMVIPGTELFLNQAAAQFELWTDGKAPRDAMREVLMERIRQA
jgi:3-dehydroquinate dehydratase/shikimate dehydrogenase